MALVQQASEIIDDPKSYLHLLLGDPGVGKTTWASQIPGHYFAKAEIGTKGVSVFGSPIIEWEDFIEMCADLVIAQGTGWKDQREVTTVIVDTYEQLFAAAARWICKNRTFPEKGVPQKFDKLEDVPFGKGYKAVNELIIEKINKLMLYGFGVVLICHMKERTVKWRGQELKAVGPDLPPSAADAITGLADAVGYFTIDMKVQKNAQGQVESSEEGRFSIWQPQFLTPTKHRIPGFPDRLLLNYETMYADYCKAFTAAAQAAILASKNR
jgi:hypothetical protein